MSVDETLLCSFQVCGCWSSSLLLWKINVMSSDSETSREEGQVPIWRDECGTTCDTSTQAKEEG